MSVDVALFVGRILLLGGLYLFLLFVVMRLRRDLRARAVSPQESAPGELVVVEPGSSGLRSDDAFALATVTLVGRGDDADVTLPDEAVSARHSRLTHADRGWVLEDLGSTNGTFINGRRIRAKTRLNYGDTVSFGGVSLKLMRT